MKQERTKDWVRLLFWAILTMNAEESSSTGYTSHKLFHGRRPVWFFKTPFSEPRRGLARANLKHVRERELTRRYRMRRHATFRVGDLVLVYQSPLRTWPRSCLQDPYCGPYQIIKIDGSRIHVRCSPRLGGEPLCAPKHLRHYHSPDELSLDDWHLSDREVGR